MMDMVEVLKVQDEKRDSQWEEVFTESLLESTVHFIERAPKNGPDGWPYLMVQTQAGELETQSEAEPATSVFQWASRNGVGVVVNPRKDYPDYIYTFGMVWGLLKKGKLHDPSAGAQSGLLEMQDGQGVLAGPPSEDYFPIEIQKVVREFLQQQGVLTPKILVLSTDRIHFDLCFSSESLGSPSKEEHQGVLEALSWFFPPYYSLVLISEKGLPPFTEIGRA